MPIYHCRTCGLEWFDRSGYPNSHADQYLHDHTSPTAYYRDSAECDRDVFDDRVRRLIEQSGRSRGRVLDVGCSVGTFLVAASARGWDAVGVEPNPAAASLARARGLDVIVGFFDGELAGRVGRFDAVHLSDVIEHVFDPVELLASVRRVLEPGGALLVTTPDFDTLSARALQRKPREHVVHFRRSSLAAAAARAGFDVLGIERIARRRSVAALRHSTTFGPIGRALLRLASGPRVSSAIERLLEPWFEDTLLLCARRPLEASREACA